MVINQSSCKFVVCRLQILCKFWFTHHFTSMLTWKIYSWPSFNFISSINSMGGMEGSQATDPLVFQVLQLLTLTTPALNSSCMASIIQLLLWCVHMIKESDGYMSHVSSLKVCWAAFREVLVETCACWLPAQTSWLCIGKSSADINCRTNIQKLAVSVMHQVDEPSGLVLLCCR